MEFGCGGVLEGKTPLGEGTSGLAAVRASHLSAALWLQMCNAGGSIQQALAGLAWCP